MNHQIQSYCTNTNTNLASQLDICDTINMKGGSFPRDAAMAIVKLINHRNDQIAHQALDLLDVCVKNCGFPFHLQIASREFLNELVRKFPNKPPMFLNRNLSRILEMINSWELTLILNGKHHRDLIHIDDMYQLLTSKGYRFPEVAPTQVAVLSQKTPVLQSADEMEFEDSVIKKAKLQELLRRATPADLDEANKIMKELVGFENGTDYKAKERDELNQLAHKARSLILELQGKNNSTEISNNPDIQSLYTQCKVAQKKVIQLIELRENDDSLSQIIDLNDLLNTSIQHYQQKIKSNSSGMIVAQPESLISLSPTATSPSVLHNQISLSQTGKDLNMCDLLGPSNHDSPPLTKYKESIFLELSPSNKTAPSFHAANNVHNSIQNAPNLARSSDPLCGPLLKQTIYNQNGVRVDARIDSINPGCCTIECLFSNSNAFPISALKWQLSTTKNFQLQISNLSAQEIPPLSTHAVSNKFQVLFDSNSIQRGQVKVKFRVGYICQNAVPPVIEYEGDFSF